MLKDDYKFPYITIRNKEDLNTAIQDRSIGLGQPMFNMSLHDQTNPEHAMLVGSISDSDVGYYGHTINRNADVNDKEHYGSLQNNLLDSGYVVIIFAIPEGA